MASFNKVIVIGNLTRDPEIRYAPSGKAVANIGLAINRKAVDGKDETTFVEITVWDKQAESCGQYLFKGDPALFDGHLQSESWTDKDTGAKRSKLIIVAERVQFLKPRHNQDGNSDCEEPPPTQRQQTTPPPSRRAGNGGFNQPADGLPAPKNYDNSNDDDIPF